MLLTMDGKVTDGEAIQWKHRHSVLGQDGEDRICIRAFLLLEAMVPVYGQTGLGDVVIRHRRRKPIEACRVPLRQGKLRPLDVLLLFVLCLNGMALCCYVMLVDEILTDCLLSEGVFTAMFWFRYFIISSDICCGVPCYSNNCP